MKPAVQYLRVVTYNVGSRPFQAVVRDLVKLSLFADVILVQEVGDRGRELERVTKVTRMVLHRGNGGGRDHVAVLVREGIPVTGRDYWDCAPRTFVGTNGAGLSPYQGAKTVSLVRIRFAGRRITIGSTHFVPSVTQKPYPGRAARRSMYRKHVARLVVLEKRLRGKGLFILGGDFNATPLFPYLRPLKKAGLVPVTRRTHGTRPIDMMWHRDQGDRITVDLVEALEGFSSDHKPLRVIYAIRTRRYRARR